MNLIETIKSNIIHRECYSVKPDTILVSNDVYREIYRSAEFGFENTLYNNPNRTIFGLDILIVQNRENFIDYCRLNGE